MAANYLVAQGYVIKDRNWRSGHRDLDIVALTPEHDVVAFVEVKTRSHDELANPTDAVDRKKITNLGRAAHNYIKAFEVVEEVRFDIITIVGTNEQNAKIEHLVDAFNPLLM